MALNGNRRAKTETLIAQPSKPRITGLWCPWQGLGDIDFNGYRYCVNHPNTPKLYGIQQGDTRAETLSFGKEIEEHAIQQDSVRVNTRMRQDIGELATQTSPLS
ncbi:hypothetical protein R3P38DRAFT_2776468 [Favolaschia claudopus]|uniref:Uncharacterized protein n=1 Tax=Favolaschia claudopus TaxID=2862362 RepID=A0AAW0BQI4_9AGAR